MVSRKEKQKDSLPQMQNKNCALESLFFFLQVVVIKQ